MLKIVVLTGGNSHERKVSLVSGTQIAKQLELNGHHVLEIDSAEYKYGHELIAAIHHQQPDLVFIGMHGGEGENGVLQAMLEGSRIPYTGSGFKASAVAMDKLLSKYIAQQEGVPFPAYKTLTGGEYRAGSYQSLDTIASDLLPLSDSDKFVVKPVDTGSSVGVHILSDGSKWKSSLADAFQYSERVLLEEYIKGRELTVTILSDFPLPVVEIMPLEGFYDYTNKYSEGHTKYQAPAELNSEEADLIQDYAVRIWKAMECSGYGRIDFRYDGKTFYFLEVNTLPGMTPLSLTPMAAKAMGINFGELLERIIETAKKK